MYALLEPGTSSIRYIGQTVNLNDRYGQHLSSGRSGRDKRPVAQWIRKLFAEGKKPVMQVLEEFVDNSFAFKDSIARERFWIKQALIAKLPLLNMVGNPLVEDMEMAKRYWKREYAGRSHARYWIPKKIRELREKYGI